MMELDQGGGAPSCSGSRILTPDPINHRLYEYRNGRMPLRVLVTKLHPNSLVGLIDLLSY